MKRCVNIFSFLFLISISVAQNEVSKWYFGADKALDFIPNPPSILNNGATFVSEGVSCISDHAGNLLFYTNGVTVWNKFHTPMANGTGLFGHPSSTQSALIIRQPGSFWNYYIFTTVDQGFSDGLRYSIVDMSLASGTGSVTTKNSPLFTPTCEKITAAKHCNGKDIWVITHDFNSNNFRSFLITSSGINSTPIISSIGFSTTVNSAATGQMKISPNGKKLGYISPNKISLYDFDNANGVITNSVSLGLLTQAYGCEFSPDGSKFYAAEFGGQNIYQWDLSSNNNITIASSQTLVGTASITSAYGFQLASNKKIYVSSGTSSLSVINNPNNPGVSCGFTEAGQPVGSTLCNNGLPNFVTDSFKEMIAFTYTTNTCKIFNFSVPIISYAAIGNTITNTFWNFGDTSSGAANTSTLNTTTHAFTNPGTYSVQLILNYSCGADTLMQIITVAPCTDIISRLINNNLIYIYPSPTSNKLNILLLGNRENNFTKLEIYNSIGKLIKQEEIIFENNLSIMNVSEFEDGAYYLILKNNYTSISTHFLKLH